MYDTTKRAVYVSVWNRFSNITTGHSNKRTVGALKRRENVSAFVSAKETEIKRMNYCTSNGRDLGIKKIRPAQIKPKGVLCISLYIYIYARASQSSREMPRPARFDLLAWTSCRGPFFLLFLNFITFHFFFFIIIIIFKAKKEKKKEEHFPPFFLIYLPRKIYD